MKGLLKVHVEFTDGRPAFDHDMPVEYPLGKEREACCQLLNVMQATGGILALGDKSIEWTPMELVSKIKITAPAIIEADNFDVTATINAVNGR
jgi:hypothetical protein